MNTTTSAPEATAMPTPAIPARTTAEQIAAINAGAYVNEFYELVYPAQTSEA